VAFTLDNTL